MSKKFFLNFLWFTLLSFPVLLLGKANIVLSKRISAIVYLLYIASLLISFSPKIKYNNIVTKVLTILSLYIFIDIFIKQAIILNDITFRDFAEIIRIFGIIFSYLLGLTLYNRYSVYINSRKILIAILSLQLLLSISFILHGPFYILNNFYTTASHRFSGIMPGINYTWVGVGITYFLFLDAQSKFQITKNKKIIYLIITISITGFETLLSVSYTSIIIFIILTFTLFISTIKINIRNVIIYALTFITLIIMIIKMMSFIGQHDLFFISKLSHVHDFEINHSLETFSSLQKRQETWKYILSTYRQFPLTGYGSGKNILSYTDNTYLMSFFRYGILGLLMEFTIYFLLLLRFKRKLKLTGNFIFLFMISFIICYLIAGSVENVFYELRTPYVAFLLFGYYYNYEENKNILP